MSDRKWLLAVAFGAAMFGLGALFQWINGEALILPEAHAQRAGGTVVIERVTCDSDGEQFPDQPVRVFSFVNPGTTTVFVSTGSGLTADTNYPSFGQDEGLNDIFVTNMKFLYCKTASGTQILNLVGEQL